MTAKEVLRVLQITRPTLTKYVKEEKIKVTVKGNGRYDYDTDSVYKMLNKDIERKTYLYARVSTSKQRKDLENQIALLKNYCFQNGYIINGIYQDIASGISFKNREQFFAMLDDVLAGKVNRVIITYKDRLSRVGFELFTYLFRKYGCEITVISEVGSEKLDSQEIFEEIISLLHCYSMKLYSSRKVKKIKEVLEENDSPESRKTSDKTE
ncbi:MAG: IS607 family transposase [Lachnospiraceae bacterium]|nr:IS607 family transposase [Lachnospiraceae bacterium]